MASAGQKVCIIGSGNWGCAIAKIVGNNVKNCKRFMEKVHMYVYEEMVNGRKLTDIINQEHENVRYLPGYKLPENVVATADVKECCQDADVLIFVMPHQFIGGICQQVKDILKPTAAGISLIKGLNHSGVGLESMSEIIRKFLGIHTSVLMGANLAPEVAAEKFCESTIGCSDEHLWPMWKELFHNHYFKVNCVKDTHTVEVCGALKNAVAIGAGIIDGLGYGDNTKAAIIRLGLLEIRKFLHMFYEGVNNETLLESCGIADLITTCYGGRNRLVAEAFIKTGKSFEELENELLNGQKLQGTHTAEQVYLLLKERNLENEFPLFRSVYGICFNKEPADHIIQTLQDHF